VTPEGVQAAIGADLPEIIADRYVVERELGHGGMATVYLCTDNRSGNKVAIKVLKPELGGAVSVERFLREITFSSQLDHPQIPKVLGSGVIGQLPYYVMTYIEGESLRSRMDRVKQFTIDEAVRITREIIVPTAYAHGMGIIHRDIKPANILLAKDRVYVLDFGVARAIAASADESLTSTGVAVGTPAYMSPEQALAEDNLDERTDIYSLACVLYEMIAGMPPFVGATAQAVMARRFVAPPPPLSEVRESIPYSLQTAVSKALCRAPADRWQTISEFGDALSVDTATTASATAPSLQIKQREISSRRKKFAIAITSVAVIALGITGIVAWSLVDRDSVSKARRALDDWDVSKAESQLRGTISKQGATPEAQLWLAQALILANAPAEEWAQLALKASDQKAQLKPEDTLRATALAKYANADAADRCAGLRSLAAKNDPLHPQDYSAAITLADCLAADQNVVRDASNPSGYSFASSWQQASRLYEDVIDRNAANGAMYDVVMPRLAKLYPITKNALRFGVFRSDTPINFAASPVLSADTIAFVLTALTGDGAAVKADGDRLERLVKRNIDRLRTLYLQWTQAAPNDATAHEYFASVLEASGRLDGEMPSALGSIDAARRAIRDNSDDSAFVTHVRLATTRVRLLVKTAHFRDARLLADSILALKAPARISADDQGNLDELLVGLAALTGRLGRWIDIEKKYNADYMVRLPSGEATKLTAEVGAEVLRLSAYAAIGAPRDSIIQLYGRISQDLETFVPPSQLTAIRSSLLRRPMSLAVAAVGPHFIAQLGNSSDTYSRAVSALDRGDKKQAVLFADSLAAFRSTFAPGEITLDVVLQEAWLRLALGDSATAVRSLDRALRGLTRAPETLLSEEIASALVRTMALRASLAYAMHDQATYQKWSAAAMELWRQADREVVAELKLQ
jgi:serine/threonine protein kinase